MNSPEAQRILLTGGTGFIGAVLARQLVDRGHQVLALVRPQRIRQAQLPVAVAQRPWPQSQRDFRELLSENGIQTCLHLAAHFVAEHDPDDISDLIDSNVTLTASLANACAAADVNRLIAAGTVWQNANGLEYQPVSLYAATKQAAQDVLAHFGFNTELNTLTLKLADTYGPHDTRRKALDLLLECARSQQPLDMSPGQQVLDLVHVQDVAAAFVAAAEAIEIPESGVAVLSSGHPVTLRQLGLLVEEISGTKMPIRWGARGYRGREKFTPWDAGAALPGWQPEIQLADGIKQLWAA